MEELIKQIRAATDMGLYYLALFGALALPDICAALGSADGKTSGTKYKAWVENWVPEQAAQAAVLYGLRCSLLHQGRAMPHAGQFPIAFTFPPGGQLHNLSTMAGNEQVGWISVPMLVDEITKGAERWMAQYGKSKTVARNADKFIRYRPEGLPPHVVGRPLIA